jgi:cytochrome c biogenesis protein CcmG/thiol:disulfide interchange protein DsbE
MQNESLQDGRAPEATPDSLTPHSSPDFERRGGRMSRRLGAWLGMGAVLVALLLLMMLPGPAGIDEPPPSADAGHSADGTGTAGARQPARLDFTLKDMDGVDVKLAAFQGKVIVLNFWATWCGPCRIEIPYLIELQRQYPDDLVVLGVSVDDTADKLKPYAAEMKINYPLLVGNGRQDFLDAYGPFWGIPVSVFIGRDGMIHKKHTGFASKEHFEHEIKALL